MDNERKDNMYCEPPRNQNPVSVTEMPENLPCIGEISDKLHACVTAAYNAVSNAMEALTGEKPLEAIADPATSLHTDLYSLSKRMNALTSLCIALNERITRR